MEAHEQHQQDLIEAFAEIVRAENHKSVIKTAIEAAEAKNRAELHGADNSIREAWSKIEALLAETGEPSVVLPGAVTDYEIYRTTPRAAVKVADPDAVPEAFCKVERKPKLKEIGDYLKAQVAANLPLPNWAAFELGEAKWAWQAIKKSAKE